MKNFLSRLPTFRPSPLHTQPICRLRSLRAGTQSVTLVTLLSTNASLQNMIPTFTPLRTTIFAIRMISLLFAALDVKEWKVAVLTI